MITLLFQRTPFRAAVLKGVPFSLLPLFFNIFSSRRYPFAFPPRYTMQKALSTLTRKEGLPWTQISGCFPR